MGQFMGAPPPEYPQAFRSKGVATKVGSSQPQGPWPGYPQKERCGYWVAH